MTAEQRVSMLEDSNRLLGNCIELLTANQVIMIETIKELKQQAEEWREQTKEWHRDSVHFQRLLIRIAKKNGRLEADEWPDPE